MFVLVGMLLASLDTVLALILQKQNILWSLFCHAVLN